MHAQLANAAWSAPAAIAAVALLAASASQTAAAAAVTGGQRLPIANPVVGLGRSVGIDGVTVVAGACPSSPRGRVIVWAGVGSGNWSHTQTIEAPTADQWFGCSLAIAGDDLFVQSGTAGPSVSGVVHHYRRFPSGDFVLQATLIPPTPRNLNGFGDGIAVSGDQLLIGAPRDSVIGSSLIQGGVYRFAREQGQWALRQLWRPVPETSGSSFGSKIIFSGAGFISSDHLWSGQRGRLVVFASIQLDGRDVWTPSDFPRYGFSRALTSSPEFIVATSLSTDDAVGRVYLMRHPDGSQPVLLSSAPDPEQDPTGTVSAFGATAAINGQYVFVGAPRLRDTVTGATGAVRIFRVDDASNALSFVATFGAPDASISTVAFGDAMVSQGDLLVIGAPSDQSRVGAVYVFTAPILADGFE